MWGRERGGGGLVILEVFGAQFTEKRYIRVLRKQNVLESIFFVDFTLSLLLGPCIVSVLINNLPEFLFLASYARGGYNTNSRVKVVN